MEKVSGIYKIENIFNGDCYIGRSVDLNKREKRHFNELRKNNHKNRHLQNGFNKYGKESFKFYILLICEISELKYYEQSLVDSWNPAYNICKVCVDTPVGIIRSEETIRKMVANRVYLRGKDHPNFGKQWSEESREKSSKSHLGIYPNAETRRKLSESRRGEKNCNFGREWSKESREKASKSHMGKTLSLESRGKISLTNSGKILSEETRSKISDKNIGTKHGSNTSSIYIGVNLNKAKNKWAVRITYNKKRLFLGYYDSEIDAALAYNIKALELYGENVKLNIIIKDKEANE